MKSNKSGFTLVEVLVVLVILIILFSLSLRVPISNTVRQRENNSTANAQDLALACFNYNTDHGVYPSGSTSTEAFKTLFPAYLQDPKDLFLVQAGGHVRFSGNSYSDLKRENICWTIVMNHGQGLTGADPTNLPLFLSDVGENYPAFPAGGTTWKPTAKNIWAEMERRLPDWTRA